jgi:hypothetical protein
MPINLIEKFLYLYLAQISEFFLSLIRNVLLKQNFK